MNVRSLTLTLLAAIASLCAATTSLAAEGDLIFDARMWIDASGTFAVEGTLDPERTFAGAADVAYINTKTGTLSCEIAKLSDDDKGFLASIKTVYENADAKVKERVNFMYDPRRLAGARRVLNVDGVEYAFRWIKAGSYTEPVDEFDPNLQKSVAATRSEAKSKKRAPKQTVKAGFWMLETEVTLEMFNQFVTETKYKPGQSAKTGDAAKSAKTVAAKANDDPYADFDAENDEPPAKQLVGDEQSRRIGYQGTPQRTAGLKRGDEFTWKNPGFPQTKKHPVTMVTSVDVANFCVWLAEKTGQRVTIPSRAEWLLASQPQQGEISYASLFGNWAFGSGDTWERGNLPDANYHVICPIHSYLMDRVHFVFRDSYRFTVPVATFKANGNGLYDMVGNVGEIVADDPNVVESLGGSWFHLPGFNPICWVSVNSFGLNDTLDRAVRDYQTSVAAPRFADPVAQYPGNGAGNAMPSPDMYGDPVANGGMGGMDGGYGMMQGGQQSAGNPFAKDNSIKPFVHIDIPDVDATCYTGFRVMIQ